MNISEILSTVALILGLPTFIDFIIRIIKRKKLIIKLNNWDIDENSCVFNVTITNITNHTISFQNATINKENVLVKINGELKSTVGLSLGAFEVKNFSFFFPKPLDEILNQKYKLKIYHSCGKSKENFGSYNEYIKKKYNELKIK